MKVPGEVSDASGLTGRAVTLSAGSRRLDAFLAEPGDAPGPGLVVIHEAFGLNDHIRDVSQRFAGIGFHVIAPNLYAPSSGPPADRDGMLAAMFGLDDAGAIAAIVAAATFLRGRPGVNGRIGCIGFCSGARYAFLAACRSNAFQAVASCWPGFLHQATWDERVTPARPVPPAELAGDVKCPLFLVGGAEDSNPAPADLEVLTSRLPPTAEVKIYPDAGHAFFADYRPTYRAPAAFRLWDDLRAFFGRHL
jgi:carboxymethylenebutenolidase